MIFHEIDGKKLGVVKTDVFTNFMVEHIFFRFMDAGRAGANQAITDLVDCLIKMFEERGSLNPGQIDQVQYNELKRDATTLIINGLIQEGTVGIDAAVFKMYNYIGQLPKREVKAKK